MNTPEIVTDQTRLEELCSHWREIGRFAFDTEFIRDETFDAALALIQVNDGHSTALIDPVADVDVTPFWELVTDPNIVTIVHAGKEDFEICLRATDKTPKNTFDVQIAAGFVGIGYPLSLSRLVDATRHRTLAKGQTMTDWLRRPLTEGQLRYAVDDVLHLPAIYERLHTRLEKTGRLDWAVEEFSKYEEPEFYTPPQENRVLKLKGAKKLDGQSLAVLVELMNWRDEWAKAKNRPTRALVRDDVLVEMARRKPKKATQLEVLRGFPQAKNKTIVNQLLKLIEKAAQTPKSQWPTPHESLEETPMMKAARDFVSAIMRAICHEAGVSQDLVGSSQRLRNLIAYTLDLREELPSLLTGWRGKFIGEKLVRILQGGAEVHLSGWPLNPRLEIIETEPQKKKRATRKSTKKTKK